ncbi:WD40 repeat domain-containing protein [bacterium]|nr:WD40 repeat domain-containing protein [bacterium]
MMRIVLAAAIGLVFICGAEVAPADLVETVDAHYAALTALDLTPDGATLVTGGKDGRLKMWDTSTYEMLVDVPACQTQINDIAVSPDSSYIVTASEDGYVKVWDSLTAELVIAIPAHIGGPESSGFLARHSQSIRGSSGQATRYGAERVSSVFSANCVAVSPDSLYIYSGGDDGSIRAWSVEDDYSLFWEAWAHYNGVNDVLVNAVGDYVYSAGADGFVRLYNASTGEMGAEILAFEEGEVSCISLNHMESCFYTGGTNGEIRYWDNATGALTKKIRAHAGNVNYIAFLGDDSLAISGGEDGKIKLWNMDAEMAGELQAHALGVRDFRIAGDTLFTGGADYKLRVWSMNF